MRDISFELLEKCRKGYEADAHAHTLNAAMAKTEFIDLAFVPGAAAKLNGDFDVEIKTHGVMAQQKSGRCWMFAAMNICREKVMEKCNLEEMELSNNYLTFFDKLEKCNNFLEMVIASADKPTDDRGVEYLLHGIGDGGYWDMAVDLIEKYGIAPKSAMPESYQSNHTEKFLKLLNSLLRKDMIELREMIARGEDPSERKDEMLAEIYKAECIVFGEPVKTFDFSYRDKNGEFHVDYNMTPQEFRDKYVGLSLRDYVTITHEPSAYKPLNKTFVWHYFGCMASSDVFTLNLSMEELKALTIAQLKDGEPVWFACDAGAYGDRKEGVWDQESLDFEGLLGGVDLYIEKGKRLEYKDSFGTHAMILTGVGFDKDGKPTRYKIENSWGAEVGKKGYFVCSDHYFNEYVYESIINKKHLSKEQLALLDQEPIRLNPWRC